MDLSGKYEKPMIRYLDCRMAELCTRKKRAIDTTMATKKPGILTHIDARGEARMVSVREKDITHRTAVAHAFVHAAKETLEAARRGDAKKGDVVAVARVAGLMAAKRTADLIPLCHPIALTKTRVEIEIAAKGFAVTATCEALDRTGVEMEALTAASVAALTIYDMLKAIDRGMRIEMELEEKSGGRSGTWKRKH